MSLLSALQIGQSGLAANQLGIQVTGNNISNSGTAGYTRQTVGLTEANPQQINTQESLGTGVQAGSITRTADEALNASLNDANADQNSASTLSSYLTQVQTTFGTLNSNDLSSQVSSFFNSFSTLANNPTDAGQQNAVVQNGVALTQSMQALRAQLSSIQTNANTQLTTLAQQANSLIQSIAALNGQIAASGGSSANTLLDQRDQAISSLSKLVNVNSIPQANGQTNVLIGSIPVVQGSTARAIGTTTGTTGTGTQAVTNLVFTDNNDPITVTSGQIAGLINARDNGITPAISTLDTFAAGLIQTVNSIYSQGQAATGFSSVTATNADKNPGAALNAATTGLSFPATNGTFTISETDQSTGQTTSRQIAVSLNSNGTPTTLSSLASSLSDTNLSATVDSAGHLSITSTNPNVTFSFSNDSSGVLASLGINTYFTGSNAQNIGVNASLVNTPSLLATGRNNISGSNGNAQAVALGYSANSTLLGGQNLQNYYTNYIGTLASQTQAATNNSTAASTVYSALFSQQQSVSGVNMDEEAINLMTYQRAYQGSANYLNVVNQMMTTLLAMVQ